MEAKILLIICVIFIKSINAFAFSTKTKSIGTVSFDKVPTFDTLQWVQNNIINNKQNFIGREFSVLLNSLPIPVKSYFYSSNESKRNISPSLSISFLPPFMADDEIYPATITPVVNVIVWQTPLPISSCEPLILTNKGNWTNSEGEFYGNKIVADVLLIDFSR